MKWLSSDTKIPALLSVSCLIAATLSVQGQPNNEKTAPSAPSPAQKEPMPPAFGGMAGRFGGFERFLNVLTDEQRTSLREAMERQREKMRTLEEKIREARRELFDAGLKETFDEDTV